MKNGEILTIYILSDVRLNIIILSDNYRLSLPAMIPPHLWALGRFYDIRWAMHVQRNIQGRSRNHSYRGKAVLHILSVCTGWGIGGGESY